MDQKYIRGELLQIQTTDEEVIEGRFHSMCAERTKITLYNVKEIKSGTEVNDLCHYYRNEIYQIKRISNYPTFEDAFNKNLQISQSDVEDLIMISKKFVYINQVDNTFHEAVDDLKGFGYIALSTDGSEMGRNNSIPFLTLSTPTQIYIFDIKVMQFHAFDDGLKALLEADTPKKIIHDCRKLSDCLTHKHNVHLNSVFDTQVGDLIITKNKIGVLPKKVKTLQECYSYYLGLPDQFFEKKYNIMDYEKRPLSNEIKQETAKGIVYLHRLSEVIFDKMMLPFTNGVQHYIDHLKNKDNCEAWTQSQQSLPDGFKNAIE